MSVRRAAAETLWLWQPLRAALAHAVVVEQRERQARAPTHATHRTARLLRTPARTKATLPALGYEYSALEPVISGTIMELHHSKHHQVCAGYAHRDGLL